MTGTPGSERRPAYDSLGSSERFHSRPGYSDRRACGLTTNFLPDTDVSGAGPISAEGLFSSRHARDIVGRSSARLLVCVSPFPFPIALCHPARRRVQRERCSVERPASAEGQNLSDNGASGRAELSAHDREGQHRRGAAASLQGVLTACTPDDDVNALPPSCGAAQRRRGTDAGGQPQAKNAGRIRQRTVPACVTEEHGWPHLPADAPNADTQGIDGVALSGGHGLVRRASIAWPRAETRRTTSAGAIAVREAAKACRRTTAARPLRCAEGRESVASPTPLVVPVHAHPEKCTLLKRWRLFERRDLRDRQRQGRDRLRVPIEGPGRRSLVREAALRRRATCLGARAIARATSCARRRAVARSAAKTTPARRARRSSIRPSACGKARPVNPRRGAIAVGCARCRRHVVCTSPGAARRERRRCDRDHPDRSPRCVRRPSKPTIIHDRARVRYDRRRLGRRWALPVPVCPPDYAAADVGLLPHRA